MEGQGNAPTDRCRIAINPKILTKNMLLQQNQLKESTSSPVLSRVYVNPNYKKPSKIHINPLVSNNQLMMGRIIDDISLVQNKLPEVSKTESKKEEETEPKTQRSVYVNPKLMTKLVATEKAKKKPQTPAKSTYIVRSNTKLVKSNSLKRNISPVKTFLNNRKSQAVTKRSPNTHLMALSKRKLVRVRQSLKLQVPTLTPSQFKKKLSPRIKIRVTSNGGNLSTKTRYKFVKNDKQKTNLHKVNITPNDQYKRKLTTKRATTMGLVSIGGVTYKSSKNQLIRSNSGSSTSKKTKSSPEKSARYIITANGKKLQKVNLPRRNIGIVNRKFVKININVSTAMKLCNSSLKQSMKTNLSNKVKQRSIQILRNKMRKNNQPCLIFQKFGYCASQQKGTCPKLHDKKQISLCKKFLKGNCLLNNCRLSHDVGPEKMPTCKYFLQGCCSRDGCPYLHVKVSSTTPICHQFLRGYCQKGNECKERHIYVCPEFDRTGQCSKGKSCHYPHKTRTLKKTKQISTKPSKPKDPVHSESSEVQTSNLESRKRYYDDTIKEDLSQKKANLLSMIKTMRRVHGMNSTTEENLNSDEPESSPPTIKENNLSNRPRRPPLGPLPAFIPFD